MQESFYNLLAESRNRRELSKILSCNEKTAGFGLTLTEEEAGLLLACRLDALKDERRVEFGDGILSRLIEAFCDSEYMNQDEYADTLSGLLEIFYLYKNESGDCLTDDELLAFMREQFDGVSCGSLDYLEGTCLERFSRAVRSGYRGYQSSQGRGEYENFSEEMHWDKQLYLDAVRELFWE